MHVDVSGSRKDKTMITLKLKAGLGNQMFQYAYARSLAIKNKTGLVIDTSWYSNISTKDTPRVFLLDKFNINATVLNTTSQTESGSGSASAKQSLLSKIWSKLMRKLSNQSDYVYYDKLANLKDSSIVEGYWNTDKYFRDFRDTLSKELALKNPLSPAGLSKKTWIDEQVSQGKYLILIHTRRGDYATNQYANKFHGLIDSKYYKSAVQRIISDYSYLNKENTTFVISGDDMTWAKENVMNLINNSGFNSYILSDAQVPDYEEIHLMSLCHHFIIANSTFSWWPAWLSHSARDAGIKKIVIAPKHWVANPKVDTSDVLPEDWIKI
jgi:hypothetical protein